MAGERQPAAVHAAVCALNTYLGNTGRTVGYYETTDAALPSVGSLASLVSAMRGGAVQTLVVLGGNPVFDAPADLDFASAMAKVPHSIALGHTVDETSSQAEWHIPRAHYLEGWGDARAVGGTLSVVQPLVLPLFGGRTPVDVLGLIAAAAPVAPVVPVDAVAPAAPVDPVESVDPVAPVVPVAGQDRPGYDMVRDTWRPILGEDDFDTKWNASCTMDCLPVASCPKSSQSSRASPLRSSRARSAAQPVPQERLANLPMAWRSSSSRPPRFTTVASRTTGGCRSFLTR